MGININWSNKHEKDIRIAETKGRVDINESNNRASVDKHTNTTNLIGALAKSLISLAGAILGGSNKEE